MTHEQQRVDRRENILGNILHAVGGTPCVRLNKIPVEAGLECELVAKCEFLNPGGSVKDRIGTRMILEAIEKGTIKPGDTLIEPTSGNTGVGLSMAAAVTGYKMKITMPMKMSHEKQCTLNALGAEVIRVPNVACDHPESLISRAWAIQKADPENVKVLDQYTNTANPNSHYDGTGTEIWKQCGGKVDMVVLTTGTGGTMSGVARKLKEMNPACIVVAADPLGSLLSDPEHPPAPISYHVEGTGYDFVPDVCHRDLVDEWIKTEDGPSFEMARKLHKQEGMLCGGSSGAAVWAATQAAKRLTKGQRCVVLLPDNIRNYLGKFADDNWMKEKGFMEGEVTRPTYDSLKADRDALAAEVAELKAKLAEK
jgi:cystathionine beta-synthase